MLQSSGNQTALPVGTELLTGGEDSRNPADGGSDMPMSPERSEPAQSASDSVQDAWTDQIDDLSVARWVRESGYESTADLATSFRDFSVNAEGMVKIPAQDAEAAEKEAFYKLLGRPDAKEGYNLNGGDEAKELVEIGRAAFHSAGLSADQAEQVWNHFVSEGGKLDAAQRQGWEDSNKAEIEALKQEYGSRFNEVIDRGKLAIKSLGLEKNEIAALEGSMGLSAMMKLVAKVGAEFSEDGFLGANNVLARSMPVEEMNAQELRAEIDRMNGNPELMAVITNPRHARYEAENERRDAMYARLQRLTY